MPKTANSAQTHKSISFNWIVWITLYVYLRSLSALAVLLRFSFSLYMYSSDFFQGILMKITTIIESKLLHMCFDRFLLAFESRDLSQGDNRLKECFLFQTEWWVVKVLFLSLRPEVWTFWKLNFINPLRFTSHQKKLRKLFTF